jgi:hypothetical protein
MLGAGVLQAKPDGSRGSGFDDTKIVGVTILVSLDRPARRARNDLGLGRPRRNRGRHVFGVGRAPPKSCGPGRARWSTHPVVVRATIAGAVEQPSRRAGHDFRGGRPTPKSCGSRFLPDGRARASWPARFGGGSTPSIVVAGPIMGWVDLPRGATLCDFAAGLTTHSAHGVRPRGWFHYPIGPSRLQSGPTAR